MAKHKPLRANDTTMVSQIAASEEIDGKIWVSGPDKLLGRSTSGDGPHEEITISGLTAETTPASGNLLLIEVGGVLKKLDVDDLPGGGGGGDSLGTGFTSGGGSGTIPDETVATCDGDFDIDGGFSGFSNKLIFSPAGIGDYANFIGTYHTNRNYLGCFQNIGNESEFAMRGEVLHQNEENSGYIDINPYSVTFASKIESTEVQASFFAGANASAGLNFTAVGQISVGIGGLVVLDARGTTYGLEYDADYSADIATNDRSIPDVGTVNVLKQTPASYANGSAPNNCIFYSTTDSKLSYKDPGGTVHNLY